MFRKILIANRGEIAIRVIRTCKEMGISPVAVYSDADRASSHVAHAYESYRIGAAPSRESYLDIGRVMEAVRKSGADAVHPGYGFLSENPSFARACADAGVVFIGPPEDAIRMMGNKLSARDVMKKAGVPVVPGSDGAVTDAADAARVAGKIGYPVMLKAASGGGGKGMRVVHRAADVAGALKITTGEAQGAFGDASVYIEKYIESPKHIEIQLMADRHGNVITYGERECSMQRRHQKVIEESPSPVVTREVRTALSEAARSAAVAANYVGAGTVEFIADAKLNTYFLEMNTRLQVEHPVTELVYGIDLVRQQIQVAWGDKLSAKKKQSPRGHAIEMRICAEDPSRNFMPSVGRVRQLVLPLGPGVRNDNSIYAGYDIPIHYDPMIGKVIVWGEDRTQAIARARRALREYRADGIRTNVDFLLWLLHEPGFVDGSYDTNYIEKHFAADRLSGSEEDLDLVAIAAAISAFNYARSMQFRADAGTVAGDPWRDAARREGMRGRPR